MMPESRARSKPSEPLDVTQKPNPKPDTQKRTSRLSAKKKKQEKGIGRDIID